MRLAWREIALLFLCIGGFLGNAAGLSGAEDNIDVGIKTTTSALSRFRQPLLMMRERGPDIESRTIERVSGEEKGPRIPEPMVFDLVRPLGAQRGEWEMNILGLIPLDRQSETIDDVADPSGLVRRSTDTRGVEWAPEIEMVLADGIAVEFELPMENAGIEAFKFAGQWTLGTGFKNRYIHGLQTIVQYNLDPRRWATTLLYVGGGRLDQTWSLLGMAGARHITNSAPGGSDVEILTNLTLFADLTKRLVGGVETNLNQVVGGKYIFLVMPQAHYEVSKHWMIQGGCGAQFTSAFIFPQLGFRLIREF